MVRLRIKLGESEVELEGDKDFVDTHLKECWDMIMSSAHPKSAAVKNKAKPSQSVS